MPLAKTVLFDGTDLSNWRDGGGGAAQWEIKDGAMTVTKGNIVSIAEYGDAHLHVEFRVPDMPEAEGQGKGNSGVYVHGCYEIQVLDSYGREQPDSSDCSAIYGMHAPLTNACLPPMEWQAYDIYFRAPRFDGNQKTENAKLTLLHNGTVVHNNITLPHATSGGVTHDREAMRGPLMLQDHDNPVSFRNIWFEAL